MKDPHVTKFLTNNKKIFCNYFFNFKLRTTESIHNRKGTFGQGIGGFFIFLDRLRLANLVEGHDVMKILFLLVLILQRNVLLEDSPPFFKTILTNHLCIF
jgi:hypothetical protein